jgi:hypothetical protein
LGRLKSASRVKVSRIVTPVADLHQAVRFSATTAQDDTSHCIKWLYQNQKTICGGKWGIRSRLAIKTLVELPDRLS